MRRKVCVVINSRANYARVKSVLTAINQSEKLELQIIAGASALLYRFGKVINVMENDGFKVSNVIHFIVEGENLATQAKSTGLGIIELTTAFLNLKPDLVVVIADRFENLAAAVAASYTNIPVAHIQGGEITGNIDEIVRHAITKLSHIHFPCTAQSRERILKLGEEDWRIFNTGCPAMDILKYNDLSFDSGFFDRNKGTGAQLTNNDKIILMVQHPVTTSFGEGRKQVLETLHALKKRPEAKIVLWPNVDAGSDDISKGIREFREENRDDNFAYFINFTPEDYARILANCSCVVGNSSSFIRECSYLGTPAVIIGDRQQGREHAENVIFSDYEAADIARKVEMQIQHGRYKQSRLFGSGDAGVKIAQILHEVPLSINKRMTY